MSFREIRLKKKADCVVCGENPSITRLIDYEDFCGVPLPRDSRSAEVVLPTELAKELAGTRPPRLVDVREQGEWDVSRIEGAELIPMSVFAARMEELGRDEDLVLYCRSGARSGRVAAMLRAAGFTRVRNLVGGIVRWEQEIRATKSR